jgi:hypothetical protein
MLRSYCDIPPDIDGEELQRRIAAFGHAPLGDAPTITLHGHTFRYVPPVSETPEAAAPAPPPRAHKAVA